MTADKLNVGESSLITRIGGSGPLRRRLLDMGLTPGTKIKVIKIAPMGDPLVFFLRGYELTLRKQDAARIEIGRLV